MPLSLRALFFCLFVLAFGCVAYAAERPPKRTGNFETAKNVANVGEISVQGDHNVIVIHVGDVYYGDRRSNQIPESTGPQTRTQALVKHDCDDTEEQNRQTVAAWLALVRN